MTDVIDFTGITTAPLPPERVLRAVADAGYDECVVIGIREDEIRSDVDIYLTQSCSAKNNLWIDMAKKQLLED